MKRRNKRQEYLNGLDHDIEHAESLLAKGKFFSVWLGKNFTPSELRESIRDNRKEKGMVQIDPKYKPWNDIPGF